MVGNKWYKPYKVKKILLKFNREKTECSSNGKWTIFGFFFICRKMTKCRSPPSINLILKISG